MYFGYLHRLRLIFFFKYWIKSSIRDVKFVSQVAIFFYLQKIFFLPGRDFSKTVFPLVTIHLWTSSVFPEKILIFNTSDFSPVVVSPNRSCFWIHWNCEPGRYFLQGALIFNTLESLSVVVFPNRSGFWIHWTCEHRLFKKSPRKLAKARK